MSLELYAWKQRPSSEDNQTKHSLTSIIKREALHNFMCPDGHNFTASILKRSKKKDFKSETFKIELLKIQAFKIEKASSNFFKQSLLNVIFFLSAKSLRQIPC